MRNPQGMGCCQAPSDKRVPSNRSGRSSRQLKARIYFDPAMDGSDLYTFKFNPNRPCRDEQSDAARHPLSRGAWQHPPIQGPLNGY